jgi:hypothetical protein
MGDEKEQLWYGKEIEKGGISNIRNYIKKIILTKQFANKLSMIYDEDIFPEEFKNEYQNKWSFETKPVDKINDIIKYIDDKYNIQTELEK